MNPEKFLEHFSNHLKNAIARSISTASRFGNDDVLPLHLLYALAEEPGALAGEVLKQHKVTGSAILARVERREAHRGTTTVLPELSLQAKRALEKAMLAAYEHAEHHVGTEHLLFGILTLEDPLVHEALRDAATNADAIMDDLENIMHKNAVEDELSSMQEAIEHFHGLTTKKTSGAKNAQQKVNRAPTALDVFTVNLTAKQAQARVDPVIGREKEIERLTRILSRRTKNNPVLIGEPGVGKTALVEGLAKKIAAGDVPEMLKKKKILSLDLPLLIAGTIYRGEFEARLKQIIEEIAARNDVVLFIDEIHTIIGAGSNQGTLDAANILKPALARGLLHCIGATTLNEYQKHIADDPALERRFQSIQVEEPSPEEAIAIVKGIKSYYEKFHHVAITDDAVQGAVALSVKYIHNNFLPDKAIDLLDEASAAVRLKQPARKKIPKNAPRVTRADIANILGTRLPLPKEWLLMNDWEHLDRVEKELQEKIVGQHDVIHEVIHALRKAHIGVNADTEKPLASFLFTGPSGVGKTELAKVLAYALYRDKKALIRLDMTEFTESHSVSKILGSPAGYVGYKERNHVLDELRRRPYAILVFDEFDKAHADVQKILFQILDEGVMRASDGKLVHLKHAIVILTANIGEELYRSPHFGFGEETTTVRDTAIRAKIKEQFGASLTGRIGHTLIFQPLSQNDIARIAEHAFTSVGKQLEKIHDISLVPDASVLAALAEEASQPTVGTRHIPQLVGNILHDLALQLIQEKKRTKKRYTVTRKEGIFALK